MKSVSEKDVYAFINAAPPFILEKMKEKIEQKLEEVTVTDYRRNVMRAFVSNSNIGNSPTSGPTSIPNESALESNATSIRDRLMNVEGSDGKSSGSNEDSASSDRNFRVPHQDLMSQFNSMPKSDDNDLKDIAAEFVFMFSDNYGDALVVIKDENLSKRLQDKAKECKDNDWYFPYGLGKDNNLLKIKKFKRPNPGEVCRAILNFSRWTRDNKVGYSCWAK